MRKLIYFLILLPFCLSCEKDIDIKLKEGVDLLVVEGHIEPNLPPYVILTKTQPFFSTTNQSVLNTLFIRNADITVSNGAQTVTLQEFSSDSLPEFLVDTLSKRLGVSLASQSNPNGLKIIVYANLEMTGVVGGVYNLMIHASGQVATAVTTIPSPSPLDSMWTIPHPEIDSLVTLTVRYSDPPGVKNYVRYFTSVDQDVFYPPLFASVLDDRNLINVDGKTFDFAIEQGHNPYDPDRFKNYTYFSKGDSIIVRWCAIDKAHYDFWSTAEFERNSGGNPFSNPTIIKTNIKGGLGIWGGYSPTYHFLVVE